MPLGAAPHLAGALLEQKRGIKLNFIGYKGGAQVMVRSGNFRMIAIVEKLNIELQKIFSPPAMRKWISDETIYWGKVIRDGNVKLNQIPRTTTVWAAVSPACMRASLVPELW